mgnify:FL=1
MKIGRVVILKMLILIDELCRSIFKKRMRLNHSGYINIRISIYFMQRRSHERNKSAHFAIRHFHGTIHGLILFAAGQFNLFTTGHGTVFH